MGQLQVRIVRLEPVRVASAHGYGEAPEDQAWKTILAWAEAEGLLEDPSAVRFFGFNNPNPHPGSPNYGYEQWITVGPEVKVSGEVELKDFPGGLYAVTRCQGIPEIAPTWKKLVTWFESSAYKRAYHQWLEECLSPPTDPELPLEEYVFDLYLPIAE
jgi:DNA gyrase inhibitor GyrI